MPGTDDEDKDVDDSTQQQVALSDKERRRMRNRAKLQEREKAKREAQRRLEEAKEEIRRQKALVLYEDLTGLEETAALPNLAYEAKLGFKRTINNLALRESDMRRRIEKLAAQIEEERGLKHTVNCHNVDVYDVEASAVAPEVMHHVDWKCRLQRTLRGHAGKVYGLQFARNDLSGENWQGKSPNLVTCAQDGKMIIWNGMTGNKRYVLRLPSMWSTSCAYEQAVGALVAAALMDGDACIFRLLGGDDVGNTDRSDWTGTFGRDRVDLRGHSAYVSSVRFIPQGRWSEAESNLLLSASGDGTCRVWDIARASTREVYTEHTSDVLTVDPNLEDPQIFLSGSCDCSAKVWDRRAGRAVMHFGPSIFADRAHSADVNAVQFMPGGMQFCSASDDGSARIFDMRSYAQLNKVDHVRNDDPVTSVAVSRTGRLLFTGTEGGTVYAWDTLRRMTLRQEIGYPRAHKSGAVTCVGLCASGEALATGGFDSRVRIWA
jgi:guanine nucleotide-binding protein G(I)/G(S)/G(T) subunit beta-1